MLPPKQFLLKSLDIQNTRYVNRRSMTKYRNSLATLGDLVILGCQQSGNFFLTLKITLFQCLIVLLTQRILFSLLERLCGKRNKTSNTLINN